MAKVKKVVKNLKKKLTKEEIEELALNDQVEDVLLEAEANPVAVDTSSLPHYADATGGVGVAGASLLGSEGAAAGAAAGAGSVATGGMVAATGVAAGMSTAAIVGLGAIGVGAIALAAGGGGGGGTTPPPSDTTAPTLSSSIPADGSTSFALNSNIILTFSEAVKAGSGNIVITNEANASDTRTIPITDESQVTINGNTVTINPTNNLVEGATYHITIASGVIKDMAGNNYAGISDAAVLNFTTTAADNTAPTVSSFTSTTSDGNYNAGDEINITATMSENVTVGSTFDVTLDTGDVVTLTAASAGTTLSGTYTVGAGDNSDDLTVSSFTVGTVTDTAGNAMSSIAMPATNIDTGSDIVIDTSAPTAPSLALATDSGSSSSDGITNIATVNVTGLESGATWEYQIDGGSWTAGSGTSFNATAGSHSYKVRQTDTAGNVGAESTAVTYNLDTIAPTMDQTTNISVNENISTSQAVYSAGVREQATFVLSGNDADDFNVDGNGNVTFKVSPDYEHSVDSNTDNVYDITVGATDLAGNSTTQSMHITVNDVANETSKPYVTVNSSQYKYDEGTVGVTPITFSISRNSSTGNSTVHYAVSGDVDGSDFIGGVLPSGDVAFNDGEISKNVTLYINADFDFENMEQIRFNLSEVSNAHIVSSQTSVSLIDDDMPPHNVAILDNANFSNNVALSNVGSFPNGKTYFIGSDAPNVVFTSTNAGYLDLDKDGSKKSGEPEIVLNAGIVSFDFKGTTYYYQSMSQDSEAIILGRVNSNGSEYDLSTMMNAPDDTNEPPIVISMINSTATANALPASGTMELYMNEGESGFGDDGKYVKVIIDFGTKKATGVDIYGNETDMSFTIITTTTQNDTIHFGNDTEYMNLQYITYIDNTTTTGADYYVFKQTDRYCDNNTQQYVEEVGVKSFATSSPYDYGYVAEFSANNQYSIGLHDGMNISTSDLNDAGYSHNLGIIDALNDTGANTVTVSLSDVLSMGIIKDGTNTIPPTIAVMGNTNDKVDINTDFNSSNTTTTYNDIIFNVYTHLDGSNNIDAQLLVQQGVTII